MTAAPSNFSPKSTDLQGCVGCGSTQDFVSLWVMLEPLSRGLLKLKVRYTSGGGRRMLEAFFDNFPKIGSWQFFAGWIGFGLILWGIAWFALFRD